MKLSRRRLVASTVFITATLIESSHAEVSSQFDQPFQTRRKNRRRKHTTEPSLAASAATKRSSGPHHYRHDHQAAVADERNVAALTPSATAITPTTTRLSSTLPALATAQRQFQVTYYVALTNALVNALRPDPMLFWPLRVPRILWELSIAFIANQASSSAADAAMDDMMSCLLLAVMTWTTGLVDIFWWSPIFATMASLETCQHHNPYWGWISKRNKRCTTDYVRGYGRLFVVAQCIISGLVYVFTSLTAWNAFRMQREEQTVERELVVMAHHQHHNHPHVTPQQ